MKKLLKNFYKVFWPTYIFVFLVMILTGCANSFGIEPCFPDTLYGFWNGLWHGLIAWFSFFGSLFSDNIVMYACDNNGGWYDFGFALGIGVFSGGAGRTYK